MLFAVMNARIAHIEREEKIKMSDIIKELEKEQLRTDLPELEIGDQVRVYVKVVEGTHERLQNFEGIVIKMEGGAYLPLSQPPHRPHRGGPSRRRPPGEAVLPPRAFRQGCQDPRAHRHQIRNQRAPVNGAFLYHGASPKGTREIMIRSIKSWRSQIMGVSPNHFWMICTCGT